MLIKLPTEMQEECYSIRNVIQFYRVFCGIDVLSLSGTMAQISCH